MIMLIQNGNKHINRILCGLFAIAFLHHQTKKGARMSAKKIDKRFLITDSTVNVYGFRLMTDGYLIDEYKKNPIGYHMHDREDGVVVRWDDFEREGDQVYAKPVINLSNERGQQTADEVENGFLNGASVGHIVVLEWSDDPEMKLPGQSGPSATKWYNRECSLVDVPGNMNALALYDKDGNAINLADLKIQQINMEKIFVTPQQLATIPGLKANPTQAEFDAAITDLVARIAKHDGLEQLVATLKTEKQNLETEVANLKAAGSEKEVTDMLKAALETDKKITKEIHDLFAVQYKGKPVELKAVLDIMPVLGGVVNKLSAGGTDMKKFEGKTFDELDKDGLLPALRAADEEKYFDMWKEEFGKPHKDDKH